MKAAPARIALIGVGGYGRIHLQLIETLAQEGLAELIAVADPHLAQMSDVRADLISRRIRCYETYQRLLAEEMEIDLLVIASPIPLHEPMVRAALARGVNVYLEKPPVPTIQQLLELIRLDREERVTVGFQMIQFPQVQQLKHWIVSGSLGDIRQITATACWPRGSEYYGRASWAGRLLLGEAPVFDGPASNALAHLVQLIMYFGVDGSPGFAVPHWVQGEFYRLRPIESYDFAGLAGGFSGGACFTALLGHCSQKGEPYTLRVEGTKGAAWLADDGATLGNDCGLAGMSSCEFNPMASIRFYREVLRRIRENEPPIVSLRDCLGYSKTVCGGLISSGGIHTLDGPEVVIGGEETNLIYELVDVAEVFQRTKADASLPSAQHWPWAVPGSRVLTEDVTFIDLSSRPEKVSVAG